MKVALVALVLVACKGSEAPKLAPVPPAAKPSPDAAPAAAPPIVDAAPPPPPAPYRTDATKTTIDPAITGTGKTFMVVSESAEASAVGRDVLAHGGTAADAVIATAFALAVDHPSAGNLGGGGFAVIRTAPGKATALDFRETAPGAATADMYLDANGNVTRDTLVGPRAAGVPGSVAGLWALHQKYGKRPWKELIAPAVKLARDGFALDAVQAAWLPALAKPMALFPDTFALWYPGGKPHVAGDVIKLPELADTLQRIAERGPDGFYKGATAAAIIAEMKRDKGIITLADLAGYKVAWRAPIAASYHGYAMQAMPVPSSGGIVLAMSANILARVELGKLPWHGVEHLHWLVETWRRAFAARNELLGDPAFEKHQPIDRLASKAYADKLAASITARATPSTDVPNLLEGNNTTNISVVDAHGMAIALTTTLNGPFGDFAMAAGFMLNNEMDDFTAKPGSPNSFGLVQGTANKIEPGKRMLSSMSPTIVEDAHGQIAMVVGGRGGPRIITGVWQTISNVLDFGMPIAEAIAAPRVHFQHLPDVVRLEPAALDEATDRALRERGYTTDWNLGPGEFGFTNAIVKTPSGWAGAADPRSGGGAVGD